MTKRILIPLQIVLILITLAGSVYAAFAPANSLMNWYNIDDAFYYYKVAQNVVTGHGFTFDQINLSNGFHPLWMLVCLGVFWLSKFSLILPLRVLVVVSGLFNAFSALLFFRFLKRILHPWAALVAALILGLYQPIYDVVVVHGMESVLSLFFIVLLLSRSADYLEKNPEGMNYKGLIWLGLIGALTILSRLDNLFVVGVTGFYVLFKIRKVQSIALVDMVVIALSVFISWIIRLGSQGIIQNSYSIYPMLLVSVAVKMASLYFAGCYQVRRPLTWRTTLVKLAIAFAAAFVVEYGVLFLLFKLGPVKLFSNSILVLDVAISFVLVLGAHLLRPNSIRVSELTPFTTFWNWVKAKWRTLLLGCVAYGSPIAVLIGAYMLFNKFTFGSFTPVSGQIKHWWSTFTNTVYIRPTTLLSALGFSAEAGNGPWSLITSKLYGWASQLAALLKNGSAELFFGILALVALGCFILIMASNHGKQVKKFMDLLIPAILLGALLQITYYTSSGYTHTRAWYWVAEMITLVMLVSLVLDWFFGVLDQNVARRFLTPLLALVFAALIINGHAQSLRGFVPYRIVESQKDAFLAETREVEFYTEPGSRIGMTGGGMVAYFIQGRTIVNLDGLINSKEYFDAMKAGTATDFLDQIPLNYVYGKPYMLLESDPYNRIFKDRLTEIGFIRGYENFTLFHYGVQTQ